eukprot:264720-Prymnesium_polylepis.2
MLNISNAEALVQHMCHRWDASEYVCLYMARAFAIFARACLHATARSINMVNRRDARRPHKT